ncbi:molybdenum cofactor guanylyltransferase [Caloramator sp. mosi_1]|uniref:molybdenum cofactor guanylyltransferase n=1 Tax=Caloramator sp. mosi_1 TaxID=3023090 RepID=UPI00236086E0|nr:molybdenum cofactor guanylyltransferase [Caloramator sp. mosi_1]WDC84114.1 molybdenum cofactor guanylyltransferase [Caloramator sp. mosi_1]
MKKFSTAAILCGGKSSRMGFDKSKLVFNDKLLIEHIAEKLNRVFDDIVFITNDKNKFNTGFRVIEDVIKDCGPIGAIYTALLNSNSQFVFVVGCDMPFINLDYIRYMKEILDTKEAECLITKKGGYFEPLCSFYSIDIKDKLKESIDKGRFKIMDTIMKCQAIYTSDEEVEKFISEVDMFANLNYKEDLEKLKYGEYFKWML